MMVSWLIPKGGTSCQDVACVDYFSFFASYPLWLQALNIFFFFPSQQSSLRTREAEVQELSDSSQQSRIPERRVCRGRKVVQGWPQHWTWG